MGEEEISINAKEIKKGFVKAKNFFMRKDVLIVLTVILLLGIIIFGSYIRLQNLPLLVDQTSGENIPLALDPFYFIRVAEVIVENGGLPDVDVMRCPVANIGFTDEILPWAIAGIYKIGNIFSDISIEFAGIISPVIFYIIGLVIFFFLCYKLTKSKIASVIASIFLAFIPSYLYRTLVGFADHEAIGMVAFFSVLLAYTFSIEKIEKKNIGKYTSLGLGILTGLLTTLTVASWGGLSNFVFMILPLSAFLIWIIKVKNDEKNEWKKYLIFYGSWIISGILFAPIFGLNFGTVLSRIKTPTGLISLFVLIFMIVDSFLIKTKILDKKLKDKKNIRRVFYSLLISIVLGIVFLLVQGNLISVIKELFVKILNPFSSAGAGRLGATVAENASPYLSDWISQTGQIFFWISLAGLFFFGFKFFEKIPKKKDKIFALFFWALLIAGIFFSNYSANSILNGENFISKLFYFGSVILFIWFLGKLYYKEELKVNSASVLVFSWMILMLIGARGAARLLFVITPFFCFIVGWSYLFLIKRLKQKDELKKIIVIILFIALIIASLFSLNNFIKMSNYQAQYTGPSANYQWQEAMLWVRENTQKEDIFIHWWDYGYWIQSLGERATVTDGGHAAGDLGDHCIGRYILTTPNPETALSFMKTHNVDYLLIDPTDLGKFSAYSRIGSDGDYDRFSYLPVGLKDSSQTQETSSEIINVYSISGGVDEDIIYSSGENTIMLPGPTYDSNGNPSYKSYLIGIILSAASQEGTYYSKQPEAVYVYNDQQIRIPLRYLYMQEELIDFGSGLDAVFFIVPLVENSNKGISAEELGAGVYLSPKVSKSLFAQLYLMNDPFDKYPTINLAHSEFDIVTNSLISQGMDLGEFVYYQGFRGPIKIWEVNYPEETKTHEEFLEINFSFGGLDYLFE